MAKYGGRIPITREALSALLGLPEDIGIEIYPDWERDVYQIVLRASRAVTVNGQQVTFPVNEGEMLRAVDYMPPERITFEVQEAVEDPIPENKDPEDFDDLLRDINNSKS